VRKLGRGEKSVHLERYPTVDERRIDRALEERMDLARRVAALGKRARLEARLKVRQPLARAHVLFSRAADAQSLTEMLPVVREELNVKDVEVSTRFDEFVHFSVFPDWKTVGKRLGKRFRGKEGQEVLNAALRASGPREVAGAVRDGRAVEVGSIPDGQGPVRLEPSEVLVRLEAKEGYAAAEEHGMVVVLDSTIDEKLRSEALAAEMRTAVQGLRKFLRLPYEARVKVEIWTEAEPLAASAREHKAWLAEQTLSLGLSVTVAPVPSWASSPDEPVRLDGGAGQLFDLGEEGMLAVFVREASGP
jgi:isoleucyl-tRNA synthetase